MKRYQRILIWLEDTYSENAGCLVVLALIALAVGLVWAANAHDERQHDERCAATMAAAATHRDTLDVLIACNLRSDDGHTTVVPVIVPVPR